MINNKQIYELIFLYDELDILDLRLHELDDVVDKVIIVEYPFDFSRKSRKMYYNENKERFKKFEHKIIHIIDDNPYDSKELIETNGNNGLGLMWNRKNSKLLIEPLSNCVDDDFVVVFDGDAFMCRESFDKLDITKPNTISMKWYLYWFNCCIKDMTFDWSCAVPYSLIKETGSIGGLIGQKIEDVHRLVDVGYHFAKCGGVERVSENIKGYPHQDYNVSEFTDKEKIKERIDNLWGWDDMSKGTHSSCKEIIYEEYNPKNYPKYLNDNPEIYSKYFKNGMNNGK